MQRSHVQTGKHHSMINSLPVLELKVLFVSRFDSQISYALLHPWKKLYFIPISYRSQFCDSLPVATLVVANLTKDLRPKSKKRFKTKTPKKYILH